MMKTMLRITGITLLLFVLAGANGCILHDVLTDLVAKHEAFADYEQREDSATWTKPYILQDYGKDLRQALEDIGYTAGEDTIITAGLVGGHYGVVQILPTTLHDWDISGLIRVDRTVGGSGSGTLIDYSSVSIQGALGQKIPAKLNGAGVAVVNDALQDLIDNIVSGGDPANDPVLTLTVVNGSVVGPQGETPSPDDRLDFDWRAWITVELVIRKKIENMYDFWK
jgi:hypothetical protein